MTTWSSAAADIMDAIAKVDSGDGVMLLTDMFGGTPSNLAISVMDEAGVEVIAGVNLPMLIKLASIRDGSDLAQRRRPARRRPGANTSTSASQHLADRGE